MIKADDGMNIVLGGPGSSINEHNFKSFWYNNKNLERSYYLFYFYFINFSL